MTQANKRWPFLPRDKNLHIKSADGAYLVDSNGRRILDAAGGAIVVNVGHGRVEVADAIAEATRTTTYVVPPWLTDEREALAESLRQSWLAPELTRIHLTCGGSEGVEAAMKLALQYHAGKGHPEKCRIIGRSVSYHGTTLATTAVGGHEARKKGLAHVLAPHARALTPDLLRCPSDDPTAYYVDSFRAAIEQEGPENVAAFLAEPITGTSGGALVPPDGYWEAIREICDAHDILILMDEIMTGFGRTGTDFGFQHWNFVPDVLVSGKGLAGGYAPIVGVFATDAVGAALERGGLDVMFHTFGAHPAACAGAVRVLDILKRENLVARARVLGDKLGERLRGAFSNHPHVAEVRGLGLLWGVEIVADRDGLVPFPVAANMTNRVVGEALKRGTFFYGGGTEVVRDIVCMGPPFIIDEGDIDRMVDTLSDAIDAAVS